MLIILLIVVNVYELRVNIFQFSGILCQNLVVEVIYQSIAEDLRDYLLKGFYAALNLLNYPNFTLYRGKSN